MESTKDTALPSKRCLNKIKSIADLTDVYVEKITVHLALYKTIW